MEVIANYNQAGSSLGLGSFESAFRKLFESLHDHFVPHARNQYHPHVLKHSTLMLWSLLLVTVKVATIAVLTFGPVLPAFSSAISQDNVIKLTNESRASFGLSKLTFNEQLTQAAQKKADDMLAKQYFAHNTPDGLKPWDFIKAVNYNYVVAGENLAIHFKEVEDVEEAWMNSPGHRANILNKDFEEIGIGISQGIFEGYDTTIVVQMFGTPMVQSYKPLTEVTKLEAPKAVTVQPLSKPVVRSEVVNNDSTVKEVEVVKPIAIADVKFDLKEGQLNVAVRTEGDVSKVVVRFGESAVMFEPKNDGIWVGNLPLSKLVNREASLVVDAYDMYGNLAREQSASFSSNLFKSIEGNVSVQKESKVSLFGLDFEPNSLATTVFGLFVGLGLTMIIVVMAVKKRVQHVNVIAHSALVVILASLLWMW
jgi:uncharacterized protein YkwD